MPFVPPPPAPKCPACSKSVYAAEQVLAAGSSYHRLCLRCTTCRKGLDSSNLNDRDGMVYCKACYGKAFGPKGFGFAGGGAGLSTTAGAAVEVGVDPVAGKSAPRESSVVSSGAASASDVSSPQRVPLPKPSVVPKPAMPPAKSLARFGSAAPKCPLCLKPVYAAEQVLAAGCAYHRTCLRCSACGKGLDPSNINDRNSAIFCKSCYSKEFGPKGFGFAGGGAGLSM